MLNLVMMALLALSQGWASAPLDPPSVTIHAVTQLIPHFEHQFDKLQAGDFLLLDLDNTVFRESQTLGTDEWYDHAIHKLTQTGISRREASHLLEPLNKAIKGSSSMRLMEDGLPFLIKKLQQRGVFVLGLTARHPNLAKTTLVHLMELGINFGLSQFPMVYERHVPGLENSFLFSHGVAFTDGSPKGMVLRFLVEKSPDRPQRIMAADDRIHHVHSLVENMLDLGIGGHVIHYLKVREEPPFASHLADLQQDIFEKTGKLVSDDEAQNILSCESQLYSR